MNGIHQPVWLITVGGLCFSRKLLCPSSQVSCHVQRAPGLTADVCSSFKPFLYHGFCILQIHHFCSVFCSPSALAFWPPCRQKQEILNLYLVLVWKTHTQQHSQGQKSLQSGFVIPSTCIEEKTTKRRERWGYESKSRQKSENKGQHKNTSFFATIALQAWEKWYRNLHHLKCQTEETCTTLQQVQLFTELPQY